MLFTQTHTRLGRSALKTICPYVACSRHLGSINGNGTRWTLQGIRPRNHFLVVCPASANISYPSTSKPWCCSIQPHGNQEGHISPLVSARWYTAVPRVKLDVDHHALSSQDSRGEGAGSSPVLGQTKEGTGSPRAETPQPNQPEDKEDDDQPKGIMARFKEAYKNYGKTLITVHVATSAVWFGSFYYAAYAGIDVVPLMEYLGISEKYIAQVQTAGVGANLAVAYLLYKLATPARYTVTIAGTQFTVKRLRAMGYMDPVPEGSSIRDLMRDSRDQVKEKYEDLKDDIRDKRVEMKDRYEEGKEKVKDKFTKRKE